MSEIGERKALLRHARQVCAVAVCNKPASARGLCQGHYIRLRKHGDPGTTALVEKRKNKGKICAVDGCEREAQTRGWCVKHYQRWMTHGDPNIVLTPPPPEHGTVTMYGNHGCRCDACRQANTAYVRERKISGYAEDLCACGKPKRVVADRCRECYDADREAPHGTESRYSRCRCVECRAAGAAAKRRRREATRVPCSHGCGNLVDGINRRNREKPPECKKCSRARISEELRARRDLVAA